MVGVVGGGVVVVGKGERAQEGGQVHPPLSTPASLSIGLVAVRETQRGGSRRGWRGGLALEVEGGGGSRHLIGTLCLIALSPGLNIDPRGQEEILMMPERNEMKKSVKNMR